MRTPEEIIAQAATRYHRSWRNELLAPSGATYDLPLKAPNTTAIVQQPTDVSQWLKTWRTWSEQHPGTPLRSNTLRTKFGEQPVYTHLDIPGIDELAHLNPSTHEHWLRAQRRWAKIGDHPDPEAIGPWLAQIIDLDQPDFAILLKAAQWFRDNPRSGHTVRRVPVPGMHTKWLARHRRLVIALLGRPTTTETTADVVPEEVPVDELDALGLKPLPREVDILLLDTALRAAAGGIKQLRAPVNELAQLPLHPSTVIIVENKEAALPIDDHPGLVIIHSLGNHLDVLTQIPWIPPDIAWYWGDIDRHGYTLLSRARTHLPQLRSLLMGADEVQRYRDLAVLENLQRIDPPEPTLTVDEAAALDALATAEGHLRIEQERLPSDRVATTVQEVARV